MASCRVTLLVQGAKAFLVAEFKRRPITMTGQPAVLPRKLLAADGKHLHAPRDENDVQG